MLSLRTESLSVSLVVFLIIPGQVTAQSEVGPSSKRAVAVRTTSAIHLDGVLDDEPWGRAEWFGDFLQKDPVQFAPPVIGPRSPSFMTMTPSTSVLGCTAQTRRTFHGM